jgi:hypothetical protein
MAITPPTYTPSGSLFGSATPSTPAYTYGNLGNTTSAYNLWGSKGNPYIVNGPSYTPGAGAPINPQPVAPVAAPINNGGGGSDYVDNTYESPTYNLSDGTEVNFDPNDPNNFRSQDTSAFNPLGWNWGKIGGGLLGGPLGSYLGGKAYDDYMLNTPEQAALIPVEEKSQWATKSFANPVATPATNAPQSFAQYADPSLVAASNARIAEQNVAIAQAQANNAPAGTVTYSDGSTGSSLSDMQSGSSGSYSSSDSGNVGVTSYGDGQYGFTDTNGEEVGYEDPDGGGGSESSGGGSYIATAATNALGKEGLDMFEGWRDYMHTAHPTFTTSYGRYRVTAPKIVSAIDKKENSTELYQDIWNEYLKPIFNLIKVDMNNPKALSDYKVMVRELTNKYLKGDK